MKNFKLCLTTLAFAFAGTQVQAPNASSPFAETISKEEMIANYHKSQGWQEQQKKDAVETYGENMREMPVGTLLTGCKELKSGKWVANWTYACPKGEGKPVMSIHKLFFKDNGNEDTTTMETLQKKYGTTEADRSGACKNAVPAKWINGVHGYIKHPVPYFGYWVSDEAGWYDYKNGETVSGKSMKTGQSYYMDCALKLRRTLYTGDCTYPVYTLALQLMSYEADLLWKQSGLKNNGGYMDVLLYIDAQGKNRLAPLSPQINETQTKFLTALENMLNGKNRNALPQLYTSDGRILSGHYLKIVLNESCSLSDYIENGILRAEKMGKMAYR